MIGQCEYWTIKSSQFPVFYVFEPYGCNYENNVTFVLSVLKNKRGGGGGKTAIETQIIFFTVSIFFLTRVICRRKHFFDE